MVQFIAVNKITLADQLWNQTGVCGYAAVEYQCCLHALEFCQLFLQLIMHGIIAADVSACGCGNAVFFQSLLCGSNNGRMVG